ncbi:hypothetical protein RRG08_046283 [Elysia crispata]|uniref:Uncharacterized protein n=1 Tax=Elysia crispata TaxID=231223 RepID=A0AAE0YMV5_9GAST|nr:hypothetical protein RRG08_046283 [Elysia crispata]
MSPLIPISVPPLHPYVSSNTHLSPTSPPLCPLSYLSLSHLSTLMSPLIPFAVPPLLPYAEKRLDGLRETIKKWDSVDRMRQELRHWLRTKQEELADIESQPSKLHSEAAELDVERLKAFREEVRAKAPAIEELQIFHSTLTQHNPSMTDPVIRAIKDDWEELLGQLDILLHERETAKAAARNLQAHQDTMDEDLENYVRELERIDRADNPMLNKSREIQSHPASSLFWACYIEPTRKSVRVVLVKLLQHYTSYTSSPTIVIDGSSKS